MVKICDVYPNGKSYNIDDLGLRARYRAGVLKPPTLLEPGKDYKLEFSLWPTSILFKPGHRIRVSIASTDFPKYGRSLQPRERQQGRVHDRQADHLSRQGSPVLYRASRYTLIVFLYL